MNSPLLATAGAVPAEGLDVGVAAHYGDPVREQRALDRAAGLVDRSHRGVVRVTGPDRLSWLHSLTTQHLDAQPAGPTAQALVLSPNGHVEHHLTLTDDGDTTWIHVEPGAAAPLVEFLDSMRFMLRVEVTDVTGDYAVVSLAGPAADEAAAPLAEVAVARTDGAVGTDYLVPRDQLAALTAAAQERGARLAGTWAYEAFRIAAHQPRYGLDTDHKTIPHEVGWIESAVHLSKGCYRGQETVARVHNLGHPPRRLVFLHLDGSEDRLPGHGDQVELDGKPVGFVGSTARHFELGPIGLALVRRTVPVDQTLVAAGVAAAQEVIVPPDAGANVAIDRSAFARR
ncbi:MAG TPA: folate-binding protein [Streptosporangiaceae bacterium]|nr:folate-binding protein [Streptosporangiaceae bacterium]